MLWIEGQYAPDLAIIQCSHVCEILLRRKWNTKEHQGTGWKLRNSKRQQPRVLVSWERHFSNRQKSL